MADFIDGPAFDIGRRIEIRGPFSWFALLGPTDDKAAVEDLATELGAVLEDPVRIVQYSGSTERLRSDLQEPASDAVIISNLEMADPERWSALNQSKWLHSRRTCGLMAFCRWPGATLHFCAKYQKFSRRQYLSRRSPGRRDDAGRTLAKNCESGIAFSHFQCRGNRTG